MPDPQPPTTRPKRTWPAFALVGFAAGIITVLLAVIYLWPLWRG